MAKHFDVRLLVALGALFLWGCPIDDAQIGSTGSSSGSASSSSGDASSSSSGVGGAGGAGGAGGMGGAVASSSSSGMGGAGGMAGMGGSGGAGGGCPEPGTLNSCGVGGCPPCPTLVAIGTSSTIGFAGTFVSSNQTKWATNALNEPSDKSPTLVIGGKDYGVALLKQSGLGPSDWRIRYSSWTPSGFSSWKDIGPTVTTNLAVSAAGKNGVVDIAYHGANNLFYYYLRTTDGGLNFTTVEQVAMGFGPEGPTIAQINSDPVVAYAGNEKGLYSHARNANPMWKATEHIKEPSDVVGTPAMATFTAGPNEAMLVFARNANQLYWIARKGGAWGDTPAPIPMAASQEPVLLALPNGDAIVAYRDSSDGKVKWSRYSGSTDSWSTAPSTLDGAPTTIAKPALALGAGDAEVELLYVGMTGQAHHARLRKNDAHFTDLAPIPNATNLVGIASATNL
ncbi:MAG: hypothetical protein IPM54_04360 [Polyangiaceae bacterium]|nr:hypothetical protein [Polyangiaceae bacterium]